MLTFSDAVFFPQKLSFWNVYYWLYSEIRWASYEKKEIVVSPPTYTEEEAYEDTMKVTLYSQKEKPSRNLRMPFSTNRLEEKKSKHLVCGVLLWQHRIINISGNNKIGT